MIGHVSYHYMTALYEFRLQQSKDSELVCVELMATPLLPMTFTHWSHDSSD